MFVKLAVLACSMAAAQGVWNGPLAGGVPAHQYPAGVSPQACPNFPNCANPAVSANPNAPVPQQWNNPAPQWNGGQNQWNGGQNQWNGGQNQWNPAPVPQYSSDLQARLNRGEYIGDGDYHGEGLAESRGFGNQAPQWNNPAPQWNQPAPQWNAAPHGVPAQIPAGVDARACPNYPFCH